MALPSSALSPAAPAQPVARSAAQTGVWVLVVFLGLALVHGLLYLFIVPPWQHYDEPNHFEYVWLVANREGLPRPGDHDLGLNRRLLTSMMEWNYFTRKGMVLPDLTTEQPLMLGGFSQLDEQPLYYLAASLPLRLLPDQPVEVQARAVRAVSLFLLLVTVFVGWGVAREIAPPGSPLRWMLPASLALLPGFVDMMTAINNDAMAIAAFSFFLWGSLRLLRRGLLSLPNLLWTVAAAGLCYLSKSTAMVALLLLPVVLLCALLRDRWRWLAWGLLAAALLAGGFLIFTLDDAALFYRSTSQEAPTRVASAGAASSGGAGSPALGDWVLALDGQAGITPSWMPPLFQPFPVELGEQLRTNWVTLGVWMWASQPVTVSTPQIHHGTEAQYLDVPVSTTPTFYAFQAKLHGKSPRVWVSFVPRVSPKGTPVKIYYDGLVVASGKLPLDAVPAFNGPDAAQGEWGGQPFTNLVRNPSFEQAGLRLKPFADNLGARILPDRSRPSLLLTALLDQKATYPFYVFTAGHLGRTFWAKFGWGNVPLEGSRPYRPLAALTFVGLGAALLALWTERRGLQGHTALLLILALLLTWVPTLLRSSIYLGLPNLYTPVARYAYPAIIPSLLVLNLGWLQAGRWLAAVWQKLVWQLVGSSQFCLLLTDLNRRLNLQYVVYFLFFIGLDALALYSVLRYYGFLV